MNRRVALLPLALVAALAAACTGASGDNPTMLPSATAVPVTARPAAVPEPAKAKTPQGADAFVRFFFTQLNVAFANSDDGPIMALSNVECSTCANYIKAIKTAKAHHHFIVGDSYTVAEVAAAPLQPLGTTVDVYGSLPARTRVDADGMAVQKLPAEGRFHFVVGVKRSSAGWLVSGIRLGS